MTSMADLVLGSTEDAQAIVTSEYPLGEYSGVNVDGLSPLHLAALHALLVEGQFDQVLPTYRPIAEASPDGPWLIKLPAEFIEALPHIAPPDQPAMAEQWLQTGPAAEAGWSQHEAQTFLARLVHFAQTASFEGSELYLCAYD